ncbi:MAG: Crp/Fnr family transcriptional regulator [Oculatellaceae cyanobacterium Prado106]|jgi:CRP/FNR family transcriptional regulator|nr:Crp/Fnr family transcriptional regulator [Oculatellaceae cyanobacterium Prado106]
MDFSEINQLPPPLQSAATYQFLTKGQILFNRNEQAERIYAVKSGQIRLLHHTQTGQVIQHYVVQPGELCAEVILFLDRYTCCAIAETDTEVVAFPKSDFLNMLQQNPDFALAFMRQVSYRLHMTKMTVELRSIRSATERVLHYLQFITPPEQGTVTLEKPFKEIATELGMSSEALSRALNQLEEQGAIARQKRRITLL